MLGRSGVLEKGFQMPGEDLVEGLLQDNGESALQQLQVQLVSPLPYDLEGTKLSEYKHLAAQWHDWNAVTTVCAHVAVVVFDRVCEQK